MNTPNKPLVLLVDDESDVRQIVRHMLEAEGYSVMEAANGREAIEITANLDNPITLMVTDVLMPLMHGRELANRISSIRPSLKVLFISAYPAEILANFQLRNENQDFLRKPFDQKALISRIDNLLTQRIENLKPAKEGV